MVRFAVGKKYECVSLYGGFLYIEIVARTNEKIIWKYDERISDDQTLHQFYIKMLPMSVWDKDLNMLGYVNCEVIPAWTYLSRYAKSNDDIDYGYYIALDTDKLYTQEQYNEFIKGV